MPLFISKFWTILSTSLLSGSGDKSVIRVCAPALVEIPSAITIMAISEIVCFKVSSSVGCLLHCGATRRYQPYCWAETLLPAFLRRQLEISALLGLEQVSVF